MKRTEQKLNHASSSPVHHLKNLHFHGTVITVTTAGCLTSQPADLNILFFILDYSSVTSASSTGPPLMSVSPSIISLKKKHISLFRRLKLTLVINFQSCKKNTCYLFASATSSIIMGTETFINPSNHSFEIFPSNYDTIRNDRRDEYGGVLLKIKNDLIFEKSETRDDVETVFTKIT